MTIEILEVIKNSKSFREASKKLSINNQKLKKICIDSNIDYSHFKFFQTNDIYLNQTFNMLIVRKILPLEGSQKRVNCICECKLCGGTKTTRLDSVIGLRFFSCGCHSKNRLNMTGSLNPAFKGVGLIRNAYFKEIKRKALQRNKTFDISKEYVWELYQKQDGRCALSNTPITFGRLQYKYETTASLDRIDSSKGYIEGNVQWVHKLVNLMKNSISESNFIDICTSIVDNHKQKLESLNPQMLY